MIMFASQGLASDALQWTSSPMSNYSAESPGYLRRLSGQDDVEDHSESEYEDIAAVTAWNTSSGEKAITPDTEIDSSGYEKFLPWTSTGNSAYRRPSIISISPRESPSRSVTARRGIRLDSPIDAPRRGSDSSLLGSFSSSPLRSRRRSSNQSHPLLHEVLQRRASAVSTSSAISEVSSRATESNWERDQIAKIRSMDSLGRKFSDVVEVVPRSPESSSSESDEEDRDYTPSIVPGRRGAVNMWSPDTEDMPTDDESEVQSLPPMATPETSIRRPIALSNFPLTSVATAADHQRDAYQYPRLGAFSFRAGDSVLTPSPEMAPAEFLRRLREPVTVRGWMPQAQPLTGPSDEIPTGRPELPPATESISSKLFRAGRTKSLPEISQDEESYTAIIDPSVDDAYTTSAPLAVQLPEVEEVKTDASLPQIKRGSFADGVEDFGFLASEISVGDPKQSSKQSELSPLLTPRPAGRAIVTPTFSLFDTPPLPTPTIKFDAMAAFLGTPTGIASAPVSPRRPDLAEDTPTMSTAPSELRFPLPPNRARPVSLQVLPQPNDRNTASKARPRSGGLAITNANLPLALSGNSIWSSEWTGQPRFPSVMRAERPGLGSRSFTMPTVSTTTSPRENRISRKPVPAYSPVTECDESHAGSPMLLADGTLLHTAGSATGSSSGGSAGVHSPGSTPEQDERRRREQRRAERKQCRRCREKRALKLLTESIMMGMESTSSPRPAGHTHNHRHHRRQQHSHDNATPRQAPVSASSEQIRRFAEQTSSPMVSIASTVQTAADRSPFASRHHRQSLPAPPPPPAHAVGMPRPGLTARSYSEMQHGPYPTHPRVTYGPAITEDSRIAHRYTNTGPAISGPILMSSTSKNLEVQRSLASGIPVSVQTEGPRPVLRRSASTSDSQRQHKRGTFARLMQAFDSHQYEGKAGRRLSKTFLGDKSRRGSTDGSRVDPTRMIRDRTSVGPVEGTEEAAKRYFRRSGGFY